jgi:hypothetical protein
MSLPDIGARPVLCVPAGYTMLNFRFIQLRAVIPRGSLPSDDKYPNRVEENVARD